MTYKSTEDLGEISVMSFDIKTRSGSDEMELLIFFGDNTAQNASSLIDERLSLSALPCVATVMLFDGVDNSFDVGDNGVSVEYNSLVRVGDVRYRYGVFYRSDFVICSAERESSADTDFAAFVTVDAQKRYCKAFEELVN